MLTTRTRVTPTHEYAEGVQVRRRRTSIIPSPPGWGERARVRGAVFLYPLRRTSSPQAYSR